MTSLGKPILIYEQFDFALQLFMATRSICIHWQRFLDQSKQPDTIETGLTSKTEIKKQLTEDSIWATFVDPTLEMREIRAKYQDQAQSQIDVIGHLQ